MSKFVRFGVLISVAAMGVFPLLPQAPVDAMVREVPTQPTKVVWTQEQDNVIGIKGPLRIAIEGRLRWLGLM